MLCIVVHYKMGVSTSWKGNLCVETFFLLLEMLIYLLLKPNNWNYYSAIRCIFIILHAAKRKISSGLGHQSITFLKDIM